MFLVGRSRSKIYTVEQKMQNLLATLYGKIVKSDWKCAESNKLSKHRERIQNSKASKEMWLSSRGLRFDP